MAARAGPRGGAKKVPRSPDATQRHQLRSPTTPSAHRTHPGASMRRYELTDRATARAFARRRTPQNGHAGGLGGARGAAEAQKEVPRSPGATQRRQFRCPTTPCAPGPTLVRQCDATARRSHDGARIRAPPNTPKWPRGRPRRRARASRRRKRSHGPQMRPSDTTLGHLWRIAIAPQMPPPGAA